MKAFWDQRTPSQKYWLAGGAALALAMLILQLAVLPLWEARRNLTRSIAANEKALQEMTALGAQYAALRQRADDIQRALSRRPRDFTLLSHLEKKAGEARLKPHIKYINPSRGAAAGAFEESSVDMRLDTLTLGQITDFLQSVESPQDLVTVKRVAIAKMKEAPEYLTMTMQASTYLPTKPGGP